MNRENIQKLIDHLRNVPRDNFNLGVWFSSDDPHADTLITERDVNGIKKVQETRGAFSCNTVACIAGHAALVEAIETGELETYDSIERRGQKYLGLNNCEASELFEPEVVPMSQITQCDAAKVLENLLETGKIDWAVTGKTYEQGYSY